jgi:hypothetical protein
MSQTEGNRGHFMRFWGQLGTGTDLVNREPRFSPGWRTPEGQWSKRPAESIRNASGLPNKVISYSFSFQTVLVLPVLQSYELTFSIVKPLGAGPIRGKPS